MSTDWKEGPPPADVYGQACWLKMHDQGGWPFIAVAHIRGERVPHESFDPLNPPPLEAWVRIPGLGTDRPLREVWNIDAHIPINPPEETS